jgi:hypothetical protein
MLVGIKNDRLCFFKKAASPLAADSVFYISESSDKFGPVCFDRYGRLSIISREQGRNLLKIWSAFMPPENAVSLDSRASSVSSVAYQDNFFYFMHKISSNFFVAKLSEADLKTGSDAEFSEGRRIDLPLIDAKGLDQYVPYQDWGYIGFHTSSMDFKIIKVKVDGNSGKYIADISLDLDYEIIDMKVINDYLYVLGKSSENKAVLYAYTTGGLVEKQETTVGDIPVTGAGANIAGWGTDKVYVYYYNTSFDFEDIMGVEFP